MICNEVQILPTTLNNQSKPNFPSLEGQRVYKSRTNRKRSVSLLIHMNFPSSNSDELQLFVKLFFDSKTKAETAINKKVKRTPCPQVPNMLQELFPNLFLHQPRCLVPSGTQQDPVASAEGLRSAASCHIFQPVYVLDIFKYINGPSLLCTGT